jgi:hypothetical protein
VTEDQKGEETLRAVFTAVMMHALITRGGLSTHPATIAEARAAAALCMPPSEVWKR